ncbi:MAG: ABC transporter permease [Ilumatobacteraceae bacterium]
MAVVPADIAAQTPPSHGGTDQDALPDPGRSRRIGFVGRYCGRPAAVVGLVFLAIAAVIAIFASRVAPFDPAAQNLRLALKGPSGDHWLGTDELGRDVLSRLIFGARVSLLAGFEAVGVGLLLGVPFGLIAGYFGRWSDAVISRVAEGVLSFPPLLLAIAIVGVLGKGITNAMLAIGVVFAPRFLRLVRGSVLAVREETYVEAARSIGCTHRKIVVRHILPNVISPLLIQVMLTVGLAMLSEASLSFLGLGVQPPDASWGAMMGSAYRHVSRQPWQAVYPGLAIVLIVLSCNSVGEGLRASIGRRSERRS